MMIFNGSLDPFEIAEAFSKYFCNICQPSSDIKIPVCESDSKVR